MKISKELENHFASIPKWMLKDASPRYLEQLKIAFQYQLDNPHIDVFCIVYIKSIKKWILTNLNTGEEYTAEEYEQKFGIKPNLPHPDELLDYDQPKKKRPKPKGFS
ncbi:hypothetical protein NIES4106_61890 (plasmid) [Fischerella sp. NIES-4106]|nr:hypothetical protein NIES4106_61580 [Fischerella sp. NIES-4106]BAZ71392.1 hypothetical protein NIES4106_61890 [Fischerella sp. NIES-4106]